MSALSRIDKKHHSKRNHTNSEETNDETVLENLTDYYLSTSGFNSNKCEKTNNKTVFELNSNECEKTNNKTIISKFNSNEYNKAVFKSSSYLNINQLNGSKETTILDNYSINFNCNKLTYSSECKESKAILERSPYLIELPELDCCLQIKNSVYNKILNLIKKIKDNKLNTIIKIIGIKETEKQKAILEAQQNKQAKLCLEDTCNIRGALENNSSNFNEPGDKALLRLSQDQHFIDFLQKACDVKRCFGRLYHQVLKSFHGHESIMLNTQLWSPNEVLSLAMISEYYKIPWSYSKTEGVLADCLYKIQFKN
ncbi:1541_t:CDS:2 [Dentiscutata erythropus]|uniref:1541_t:CDS:1 n=1 Tax=Dentiscutata erythropus TaxID=1348616 RepID=A0A9N9IJU8_9GLOM|nr:1541_t:CDS:2 [Dentiscutata erythropus]